MATCSKCGRELREGESQLCPACKGAKHETGGKVLKVLGALGTLAGLVLEVVTKGKFRPKGN